jgi:predicted Rossmann-fold nucleotide-binding protein
MRYGLFGSAGGDFNKKIEESAYQIGKTVALLGHELVTGGCPGYPHIGAMGALDNNGKVIGYSPATNREDHIKLGYPVENHELVFIPNAQNLKNYINFALNSATAKKLRNIASVASCDACIFIEGRWGTLHEFSTAYDTGKLIGILEGSGGAADEIPT